MSGYHSETARAMRPSFSTLPSIAYSKQNLSKANYSMTQLQFQEHPLQHGFVPDLGDFEEHGNLAPVNYPPFPQRLLANPNNNSNFSGASAPTTYLKATSRRVRPIAVLPPPGFETGNSDLKRSFSFSIQQASSAGSKQQVISSGYSHYVKIRAIAGALAGDWSSNRALPDIPSFLLAEIVQSFMSSHQQDPLHASSSWTNEDLASFCQQNNISSNLLQKNSNNLHVEHVKMSSQARSSLDSRLITPASYEVSGDNTFRRRLAPTQITADALFTAPDTWKSSVKAEETVTPQKTATSKEFQRTPRAPKAFEAKNIPVQLGSAAVSFGTNDDKKSFQLFSRPGDMSTYEKKQWYEVADQTFEEIMEPVAEQRAKIPPPPKSSPQRRLSQRQKQIAIGKNTPEYRNFSELFPRDARTRNEPSTPDICQEISKRNWEGQVKAWRRRLHEFDEIFKPETLDYGFQEGILSTEGSTSERNEIGKDPAEVIADCVGDLDLNEETVD